MKGRCATSSGPTQTIDVDGEYLQEGLDTHLDRISQKLSTTITA